MEQGWSLNEICMMCYIHPRSAPGTPLGALGGGQGREWVPGLLENSGLGSRKLGSRGRREGHRPCLPSKQPPPSPFQAGHFLARPGTGRGSGGV